MKYCILYITFLFFAFINSPLNAQNNRPDSLLLLLKKVSSDTAKINLLNSLCIEYISVDNVKALNFASEAELLSEKHKFKRGLAQALNNEGSIFKDQGDYKKSLELFLKSLELCESLKDEKDLSVALTNIGLVFKDQNNFAKSLEYLTRSLAIAEKIHDLNCMANALNGLGSLYWKFKNFDKALIHYIKSLDIRESLGVKKDIAASLNNLGTVNKDYSNYRLAQEYYEKSLNISNAINDKKGIAYTLTLIGNLKWEEKLYSEAIAFYINSLKIREEIGNKKEIAGSYNNIGTIFLNINNYNDALEYYQKALKLNTEIGDQGLISYTLNYIGSAYWKLKDYKNALKYYSEALEIRRGLGDKISIANSLKNMGIVYKENKDFDMALESYHKALNIYEDVEDKRSISTILIYEGNVYVEMRDFEKAKESYHKSLEYSNESNLKEGIAYGNYNLGELYFKMSNMKEALVYFDKALSVAKDANQKDITVKIYKTLNDLYANISDYKKAWEFHKLYSAMRDSIQADEGSKKVAESHVKYLTYKQKQEMTEKKNELLLKQAELKKEKYIRYFLIIGILVVFIILGLLYKQFMMKKKSNELLAQKNKEIADQSKVLEFANNELITKNTQITDSITYAKLIQDAMLLPEKKIKHSLPDMFIYNKPRDIVSGDFYWFHTEGNKIFFAVVDCTGHGVPGGFMSMIGYTLLNDIVKEKKEYNLSKILDKLNAGVYHTLNQNESKQDDGMDLTICCFDLDAGQIQIALANHNALLIQGDVKTDIKGDIYSIGGIFSSRTKVDFKTQIFDIKKDTSLYLFSDGILDQMGDEEHGKFGITRFENVLYENRNIPICEQFSLIDKTFKGWKGSKRQIDDVLVVGIKLA